MNNMLKYILLLILVPYSAQNKNCSDTLYIAYSNNMINENYLKIVTKSNHFIYNETILKFILKKKEEFKTGLSQKEINTIEKYNNIELEEITGDRKIFCLKTSIDYSASMYKDNTKRCYSSIYFFNNVINQKYIEEYKFLHTLFINYLRTYNNDCHRNPCGVGSTLQYDVKKISKDKIQKDKVIYIDNLLYDQYNTPVKYVNSDYLLDRINESTILYFLVQQDNNYFYFEEVDYYD